MFQSSPRVLGGLCQRSFWAQHKKEMRYGWSEPMLNPKSLKKKNHFVMKLVRGTRYTRYPDGGTAGALWQAKELCLPCVVVGSVKASMPIRVQIWGTPRNRFYFRRFWRVFWNFYKVPLVILGHTPWVRCCTSLNCREEVGLGCSIMYYWSQRFRVY